MAEVNKVEVNGETILDLTKDTVTEETLDEGITAHDATGRAIKGTRSTTIAWDNVTGKPFEGGELSYIEWDGSPDTAEYFGVHGTGMYGDIEYWRVSTGHYENLVNTAKGRVSLVPKQGAWESTEIGSPSPKLESYNGSRYSYSVGVFGGSVLIINEPEGVDIGLPNGVYFTKNDEYYVSVFILYDYPVQVPETLKLESLPKSAVTIPNGTAADMVPVSNGAGGVTWVSRDELGGVEEELPPDSEVVVEPGEPGWTYVPNLSAEGDLGFNPVQFGANEGPTVVPPVNIRGPQGPAYVLTEEDKAEIVEAVKSESLFDTDATLKFENGVLGVNTATDAEQDNTLPITSAAVYETLGNIEILLGTI